MTVQEYIDKIQKRYITGISREHSYRGDLLQIMRILSFFLIVCLHFTCSYSQSKLSELVQRCKPSIFIINTYDKDGKSLSLGTGFFIDPKGIALSNYHVFEGAKSASITTFNGNKYSVNNIIAQNKEMDIIKFSISLPQQKTFPYLTLAQIKPKEGDNVFVIGNPQGLEYSVSNGIVSSLRYDEQIGQTIQTTTPISHGNSGSPLINMNGEVIGIISFSLIEGQNLNFAMSVSNLFSLNEVNSLIFPELKKSPENVDLSFKRFDWGTYSSLIRNSEKLEFKELFKTVSNPDEFSLIYFATIGNAKFEIWYEFKNDKLTGITFHQLYCPTIKNITACVWWLGGDFNTVYACFLMLQEKFIDLLGADYIEQVKNDNNLITDKSKLIGKEILTKNGQESLNNIQLLKNKFKSQDKSSDFIYIYHSWKSELNNAEYYILLNVNNYQDWGCSLMVRPLKD
jgi:hypothetical protein